MRGSACFAATCGRTLRDAAAGIRLAMRPWPFDNASGRGCQRSRRGWRMLSMKRVSAGLVVGLTLGFTSGCLPHRPIEAGMVLADMATAGESGPLQRRRPEPRRESVSYAVDARTHQGDFYVSGDDWKAGLVLVPGAAEKGKDDPRLVAFAESLARARFAVLVPDMPNVRRFRLGARDVRDIADAVVWLASREDLTRGRGVGIAAASYAVGPAVMAALEPDARRHAGFVFGIGGYHDLERTLTFLTTGHYPNEEGRWIRREVDPWAKWWFALGNASRLEDTRDGDVLARIARARLADPEVPVQQLAAGLGSEATALYRLLVNDDPGQVPMLLRHVPDPLRAEWDRLNPAAADLARLEARLILVHGRDDRMIPYPESVALAEAAPDARVFLVDGLAHVDLEEVRFLDALRLWRAVGALLAERSRAPPSTRAHPEAQDPRGVE